ncbi:MAG: hypothetical protein KJO09_09040 [Gammaproteobacteria bacterium]|nr:hypothetical protein [Gammaproteobacteria bacterium]
MTRKSIDHWRFFIASTTLVVACIGIIFAVRTTGGGVYSTFVAAMGGVVFTLIPASVYEWLVHRYIYHNRSWGPLAKIYHIHHQGHHAKIFPTWRYTTNGPVRRHPVLEADTSCLYPPGWRNLISKFAHFCFYMSIGLVFIWTPAWLLTQNPIFLASIVLTSIIISDLFVRVHDAIHYPGRFKLVEAQPWFPFIDRHHFIHHVDLDANVNFLLPLADWCYGTLRTELTSAEIAKHGTLEQAKATMIGQSEPAAMFATELRKRRTKAA